MSISSTTNRVAYTGNGATDEYDFTFKIFAKSDLLVTVKDTDDVEETLVLDTDYTIPDADVGASAGGTITLTAGNLTTGYTITIRRVRPLTQTTDIRNQGDFYPEVHEDTFDHLVMVDQQQQDELDRSIKLPESYTSADFDIALPAGLVGAVSKTLATNATGDGFEVGPSATDITTAQTAAETAQAAAELAEANAEAAETLAEAWASKIDGQVDSTDYSSKAWAIGGTGVTDTATRGAAKEWAIETASTVDGSEFSAKEYAQGTQASTGGSAKDWAQKTSASVDGSNYSAKEHAQGTQTRGLASGGSAKDWANYTGGTVDNAEYSAKYYASQAATSASQAATSAAASNWSDVVFKSYADSPISIVDADAGKLFAIDCSGGNVVVNLPAISGLTLSGAWSVGVKKTESSAYTITINGNGSDTIDGSSAKVISRAEAGANLIPDADTSPDEWTSLSFGEVPIAGTIVGTSDAQTLTNKTFDDSIIIKEIATPSNPSSGYQKLFFSSADNKPKRVDSSGNVLNLGGGLGGGLNLESEPYAQAGVNSWGTYDDGASSSMVDGTGGTASSTFTTDATTTQILSGDYKGAYKWTLGASDCQGEGVSKTFTIPSAFMSRGSVYVSFRYSSDVALSTGDFGFYAYDVTNATLLNVNGLTTNNLVGISANKVGYSTMRINIASTTASLRVGFHRKVTTATATNFYFSDFKISDSPLVDAPIVGEEETVTVTATNISGSSLLAKRKRLGSLAKYKVSLTSSGVATGTIKINLPSGDTIDYTKLNSSTYNTVGTAYFYDASTGNCYQGTVRTDNGANAVYINGESGTAVWNATVPVTVASSDIIDLNFELPLSNFSQSARLSTTEMMNQTVKARYYATSTAAVPNSATIFDFSSSSYDSHSAVTTGASWKFTCPKSGYYRIASSFVIDGNGVNRFDIVLYKNGSSVKANYDAEQATQTTTSRLNHTLYLSKGDYIDVRHSETGPGASTYSSAGQSIEIEEIPDFSVYSVYGETSVTESKSSGYSVYSTGAGTYGDLTSILLDVGTYDIDAQCQFYNNNGASSTAALCTLGVSTTSGNFSTGLVEGDSVMNDQKDTAPYAVDTINVFLKNVLVTTPTTYYLKSKVNNSITNIHVSYKISARKIK